MAQEEKQCIECGKAIYFEGICYECRMRKNREKYQSMPETEVARKIEAILQEMDDSFYKKKEYDDFFGLLAFRGISTEKIAEAAASAGVYWPCELYRNAAPSAREKLITALKKKDCQNANHILQCLAIAGGADVLAVFRELEANPLPWSKFLHVPPSVYAHAGGWTFDKDGNRIELNFPECYPAIPAAIDAAENSAVSVAVPREDTCPHCASRLIDILTIDGNDKRLAFLGLSGKTGIPVCPQCAPMCERTMVRYRPDGNSSVTQVQPFGKCEKMHDEEYAQMTSKRFALAERPAPLFFARGNDESIITIGGFADWIQDFQYDPCPDCGKTMRYLASVPWAALSDYSEGTLFLDICSGCQIISVIHQQT
ncbi:MAG: hypothetical protein LBD67_07430 [Candidatus Accumulibacter sp.]|nr:hypothetical protein [Accumulibacter sp.]